MDLWSEPCRHETAMRPAPKFELGCTYVLSPEEALDTASTEDKVLMVFNWPKDFARLWGTIKRKCEVTRVIVVIVEPTEEAAVALQLNVVPTYTLFRQGNEAFSVVGDVALYDALDAVHS